MLLFFRDTFQPSAGVPHLDHFFFELDDQVLLLKGFATRLPHFGSQFVDRYPKVIAFCLQSSGLFLPMHRFTRRQRMRLRGLLRGLPVLRQDIQFRSQLVKEIGVQTGNRNPWFGFSFNKWERKSGSGHFRSTHNALQPGCHKRLNRWVKRIRRRSGEPTLAVIHWFKFDSRRCHS